MDKSLLMEGLCHIVCGHQANVVFSTAERSTLQRTTMISHPETGPLLLRCSLGGDGLNSNYLHKMNLKFWNAWGSVDYIAG